MRTTSKLPSPLPLGGRQLPERILVAAHQAIDLGDLEAAIRLLGVVEGLVKDKAKRPASSTRRTMESLVAAHQRIWNLRHRDIAATETPLGMSTAPPVSWNYQQEEFPPVSHVRWSFWNRQTAENLEAVEYSNAPCQ